MRNTSDYEPFASAWSGRRNAPKFWKTFKRPASVRGLLDAIWKSYAGSEVKTCAKLDSRESSLHISRFVKGKRYNLSPLPPFSTLSLHENISQTDLAEQYCKLLSTTWSTQNHSEFNDIVTPVAFAATLHLPFTIEEPNAANS